MLWHAVANTERVIAKVHRNHVRAPEKFMYIDRLREMNKQRLEALEDKLLELHRQKYEWDGQSDDDPHPSYFRHTKKVRVHKSLGSALASSKY